MSKIYVVGIGSGDKENMTVKAVHAIEQSDIIIGYSKYIELVQKEFPQKEFIASSMKEEVERCELTIQMAEEKNCMISLISSGDSGIYGMASVLLETANKQKSDVEIEIIPGVTSAVFSAALLGAPIAHDFAVISLSDLLTSWELIEKRIEMAAKGDFVICFYNPKSKKRKEYVNLAIDILLQYKEKNTPVGIVKNAGREEQSIYICMLQDLKEKTNEIDMFSTIIVGNSQSYVIGNRIITPRGYFH